MIRFLFLLLMLLAGCSPEDRANKDSDVPDPYPNRTIYLLINCMEKNDCLLPVKKEQGDNMVIFRVVHHNEKEKSKTTYGFRLYDNKRQEFFITYQFGEAPGYYEIIHMENVKLDGKVTRLRQAGYKEGRPFTREEPNFDQKEHEFAQGLFEDLLKIAEQEIIPPFPKKPNSKKSSLEASRKAGLFFYLN
jgi:hypothetical protein